ncbi:MAG: pyridoxal phosphate-dependent aminotransferase [Bacteroidota bacterium]
MSVNRLKHIPGFSIDTVAEAAGNDPEILRLENLDTDILPPENVLEATRKAIGRDQDNSYLPFVGQEALRELIANQLNEKYASDFSSRQVVLSCGATEAMLNVLLATTDPGDEVVLTDPTYAGMIYRVKLAGAVPRLVPFEREENHWHLDLKALRLSIRNNTRALFIMNPSMPSGAVLSAEDWETIADLCREHQLWLIYNASMERLLFDGKAVIHPLMFEGMRDRTITLGSVSKEYRMIGWRLGWAVAPHPIIDDIARVGIYNAVTPTGISQAGALEALKTPESDFVAYLSLLQERRDIVNEQLKGYDMLSAAGGWSQLLDVSSFGMEALEASRLLLERGKVAATHMTHWGEKNSQQFIRLVFSNEPVGRLKTLRERFDRTFKQ